MEKHEALIRQSIDESFLIVMKAVGGDSNPQLDKELARHKKAMGDLDSGAAFVTDQLEFRVIADVIAWCVVFVISVWALSLNNRKQT
jgi:hypothetical protein